MNVTYNNLEKKVLSYTPLDIRKLRKAYQYASSYHKNQLRASFKYCLYFSLYEC